MIVNIKLVAFDACEGIVYSSVQMLEGDSKVEVQLCRNWGDTVSERAFPLLDGLCHFTIELPCWAVKVNTSRVAVVDFSFFKKNPSFVMGFYYPLQIMEFCLFFITVNLKLSLHFDYSLTTLVLRFFKKVLF